MIPKQEEWSKSLKQYSSFDHFCSFHFFTYIRHYYALVEQANCKSLALVCHDVYGLVYVSSVE